MDATEVFGPRYGRCGIHFDSFQPLFHARPKRVIVPIHCWFLPHASSTLIRPLHFAIRKLAHVMEFAVFSITVFRRLSGPRPGWRLNSGVADVSDCRLQCGDRRIPAETYVPRRHASCERCRNRRPRRNPCPAGGLVVGKSSVAKASDSGKTRYSRRIRIVSRFRCAPSRSDYGTIAETSFE